MRVERKDNKIHFEYFNRAHAIISFHKEDDIISIDVLRVEPAFRRIGIASILIEEVLNYINSFFSKIEKIVLDPLPLDENGAKLTHLINFYKKYGFALSQDDDESKPYLMTKYL